MRYPEAIQFLYNLRLFGLKLGLENTFKLAALLGNPQERLRFIHVAGTNGKGSTCAMLESIYRTAGLRVGLFTSPHLVSFRERIQVNRKLISEADVVRLLEEMQPWLKEFPKDHHPTFFEVVTVMALRYFAEQKCDLVIWETGMGGRLDATNIVTPLASVITNVQVDHQQWLGNTITEIATEKAGIIKPGVTVVTTTDAPEALEVIAKIAREGKAPLTVVPIPAPGPSQAGNRLGRSSVGSFRSVERAGLFDNISVSLLGEHQRQNAALAIATVGVLRDKIPVSDEAIRTGLETIHWPGRLQLVKTDAGQTMLLDGAHNAAGAEVLRDALRKHFPKTEPTLILGVLQDKDWEHICKTLAPLAGRILLAPVNSDRTAAPEALREPCQKANPAARVAACPSLADALKQTAKDPFIIVTGSLYLVGEAMEVLNISPVTATDERGLNEWSRTK